MMGRFPGCDLPWGVPRIFVFAQGGVVPVCSLLVWFSRVFFFLGKITTKIWALCAGGLRKFCVDDK